MIAMVLILMVYTFYLLLYILLFIIFTFYISTFYVISVPKQIIELRPLFSDFLFFIPTRMYFWSRNISPLLKI